MIGMLRAIALWVVSALIKRRVWITSGPGNVQVYCDQDLHTCLEKCGIARHRRRFGHIHDSTRSLTVQQAQARGGSFCINRASRRR